MSVTCVELIYYLKLEPVYAFFGFLLLENIHIKR